MRNLFYFLICFFLITLSEYVYSDNSASINEEYMYKECVKVYNEKNITKANQFIEDFISKYPNSQYIDEIYFMKAFLQKNVSESIKIYKMIIEKYPKSKWAGRAHFQLGQIYYLQGKYGDAADHYGKILVYFTDDDEIYWTARYWRCKTLLARGDYNNAIYALESLKNSTNKGVSDDVIMVSLGQCYIGTKEYTKAESVYRSLIESMPESEWIPSAYLFLAKSLQEQGKLDSAKTYYMKLIGDYSKSIEAKQAREYLANISTSEPIQKKTDVPKTDVQLESQFLRMTEKKTTQTENVPATKSPETSPSPPFQIIWKDDVPEVETRNENYYTVQVGAFSQKSSAESISNRLKRQKYDVQIIEPSSSDSVKLFKVRVGKFKTSAEAKKVAQKLNESEKIESRIVEVTE